MKKLVWFTISLLGLITSAYAIDIIGANPIIATQIADNAITADKISDDAITQDSISDNSILAAKLQSINSAADEECLTSEGTGFEWQTCGGGSSVVTELVYNFTASELRKANTTPVELLPAPGADKAYVPLGPVVFSFSAGTYPYAYETTNTITYTLITAANFTVGETVTQDDVIVAYAPTVGDCTAGETLTFSPSGETATVIASDAIASGYTVITGITGAITQGVETYLGGTSGCAGDVTEYGNYSLATGVVDSVDGSTINVSSVSGTFNNVFFGGSTSNAIAQIDDYSPNTPVNPIGTGAIHYGATVGNTFVDGAIDQPTQGSNTDKIVLLPASQQVALRAYSYFNNQPIIFSTTSDWTDQSDNDSNGDGTATLYLYYKTIDL